MYGITMNPSTAAPSSVAAFNFLAQQAALFQQTYQNGLMGRTLPPNCFMSGNSGSSSSSSNLPAPSSNIKLPIPLAVPPLTRAPQPQGQQQQLHPHHHSQQSSQPQTSQDLAAMAATFNNPFLSLMYFNDTVVGDFMETRLENKPIFAFSVGGEKRLCLPQVLNHVLFPHTTLQEINQVCESLHIFCKRCNTQQMRILKERNVFGPHLDNCGLITKSDAERLCKVLLHRNLPKYNRTLSREQGIAVYHNCFGKQRGFLLPNLYSEPDAACVVCLDCNALLSPTQFVGHTHDRQERRTCHWGFDTAHWRNYIMLEHDSNRNDEQKYQLDKVLEHFKIKFDRKRQEILSNSHEEAKRMRREQVDTEDGSPTSKFIPPPPSIITSGCAKGPIPHSLRQGSSILAQPVEVSAKNSADPIFVPNVRLAPLPLKKQLRGPPEQHEKNDDSASLFADDWERLCALIVDNVSSVDNLSDGLHMVERLRRGYSNHMKRLATELEATESKVRGFQQLETELEQLRRFKEERQTPDVRKMKMKYSAQKEEIRQLELERNNLLSKLAEIATTSSDVGAEKSIASPMSSNQASCCAVSEDNNNITCQYGNQEEGPPALELCTS